jgi:hypothetical protein
MKGLIRMKLSDMHYAMLLEGLFAEIEQLKELMAVHNGDAVNKIPLYTDEEFENSAFKVFLEGQTNTFHHLSVAQTDLRKRIEELHKRINQDI